ncbi:eukaryotic translation initiation factor 3 subunit A [Lunasporangiospora selenospora]|uniref:Eukaryotic translation initiation factor 3 subunit A n=1 Tax=Lunasporangiospora selenospora TaxID=979761 RepID=A0A9P6KDQ8_9FUNG|nr:eukaryotic translation initiation factor 3 subunit A [Lunasporangiospora selenospora]
MAPFAKPESVLRRADELIAVGQNAAALEALHDVIVSKRSRSVALSSLEPIVLKFVELCVNLRKGKIAKEGLHQYKNISQNTSIATIELVIKKFISMSEEKVQEAQAKADQITLEVDDLEATETPESILLSSVSGEQNKDRTDRAVVTPWLKFLWEAYRTVLDILRNNARLEALYQITAHQAFQFCLKYTRKTEFRRLCDLLRNHLQNVAKYAHQAHSINLNEPESLQRHLDTRFLQLNAAAELELWQEAFRSVEDIHNLMTMSKKMPKPFMMANYYEKLTKIFMVSDNYLFHAAAWNKYYTLVKTQNKSVTDEEQTRMASLALIAALAIPVISLKDNSYEVDESKNKSNRLAALLGLSRSPNRSGLLKEALSKNILKHVRPELRELYNILEVQFHPLSICKKIEPIMARLAEDPELVKYVKPLHKVILTRLFQQLSQVYTTVKLDFVIQLASFPAPFNYDSATIEKFIMQGCKKGELSIRIDHATQSLTFESDLFAAGQKTVTDGPVLQSLPSDLMRSQLTRLATCLDTTITMVSPEVVEAKKEAKKTAFMKALNSMKEDHRMALERKAIIERKKELLETIRARIDREEAHARALERQKEQEAQKTRVEEERRKREQDRMKAEQDAIRKLEAQKLAETFKTGADIDMDGLTTEDVMAMKIVQIEKERKEMATRTKAISKRLDHVERAMRLEEIPLLARDYERQQRADRVYHEAAVTAHLEAATAKHAADLVLKKRMIKILDDYSNIRKDMEEKRKEEFAQKREAARIKIEEEKAKRVQQYRDLKAELEIRREREAEEKAEREAEESRRAEEEERKRAERQAQAEKEKDEYESRRRELDAVAQKQREKEAEIEQRFGSRSGGPPAVVAPPKFVAASTGGERPNWREREAMKAAAAAEGGSTPSPPPPASAGAYRPPSARGLRSKHHCVASGSFRPLPTTATWSSQRRSFIQLPSLPKLPDLIKPMSAKRHYKDRTLLKYSQQEFYDLVANVDDYQLFLPWCTYSKMSAPLPLENQPSGRQNPSAPLMEQPWSLEKKTHPTSVVTVRHGELGIGFSNFQERYVSKVTCQTPWTVQAVSYDSKLFRELSTTWKFMPNVPKTTTLEATMDVEVDDESQLMKKDMVKTMDQDQDTDMGNASRDRSTLGQDRELGLDQDQASLGEPLNSELGPVHHFTAAAVFGSDVIPSLLNTKSVAVSDSSPSTASTAPKKRVSLSPPQPPKEQEESNPESSDPTTGVQAETAVTKEGTSSSLLEESQPSPSRAETQFPRPPLQTIKRTASPSNLATMNPSDYPSCWVDFEIQFEFASPVHASMSSLFFDQVSREMLQAFVKRAEVLYGKR